MNEQVGENVEPPDPFYERAPEAQWAEDDNAPSCAEDGGSCSTCGGDGSGLTPENDGQGAQCPTCGTWNIDFCPDCGDEFEAPCIRHTNTEHY